MHRALSTRLRLSCPDLATPLPRVWAPPAGAGGCRSRAARVSCDQATAAHLPRASAPPGTPRGRITESESSGVPCSCGSCTSARRASRAGRCRCCCRLRLLPTALPWAPAAATHLLPRGVIQRQAHCAVGTVAQDPVQGVAHAYLPGGGQGRGVVTGGRGRRACMAGKAWA